MRLPVCEQHARLPRARPLGTEIQAKWLLRQAFSDVFLSRSAVSNYFILHSSGRREDRQPRSFLGDAERVLGYFPVRPTAPPTVPARAASASMRSHCSTTPATPPSPATTPTRTCAPSWTSAMRPSRERRGSRSSTRGSSTASARPTMRSRRCPSSQPSSENRVPINSRTGCRGTGRSIFPARARPAVGGGCAPGRSGPGRSAQRRGVRAAGRDARRRNDRVPGPSTGRLSFRRCRARRNRHRPSGARRPAVSHSRVRARGRARERHVPKDRGRG